MSPQTIIMSTQLFPWNFLSHFSHTPSLSFSQSYSSYSGDPASWRPSTFDPPYTTIPDQREHWISSSGEKEFRHQSTSSACIVRLNFCNKTKSSDCLHSRHGDCLQTVSSILLVYFCLIAWKATWTTIAVCQVSPNTTSPNTTSLCILISCSRCRLISKSSPYCCFCIQCSHLCSCQTFSCSLQLQS